MRPLRTTPSSAPGLYDPSSHAAHADTFDSSSDCDCDLRFGSNDSSEGEIISGGEGASNDDSDAGDDARSRGDGSDPKLL